MQRDIGKPLFDLFLLITSAAAFVAATALPSIEIVGDLSPAFFPKLLSGLIFLFAIPCLIKDFREWWSVRSAVSTTPRSVKVRSVAQWLFIVALLIGYMLAFERLGYVVSTASFTFCCVLGLVVLSGVWGEQSMAQRGKSVLGALVFAVVLAVAVFYVFNDLFEIPLPA
ncbi:tripartite tricarboxylate transporter TctB family protein [Halomonas sp. HG01]|uniref:tripartite tricarboxylate transporter TctB family protein n=1 Tax=Halomonas sp. HG01 TaxID=1609967 RepID=UPI00061456C8|nr:tripartite tricarboxylate transporter TctB family protein [Halomonas sp. HG01]